MIKKSWQKIKYNDNEILITFKGLLVAQVCLRPGYAPLRIQKINPALPNHKYHAKQQAMNKLFKPCWSQWELFLNSCNLVLNPFIQGGTAFPWKTMWFFKRYLAAPRPPLGHYRWDNLTRPMKLLSFANFD